MRGAAFFYRHTPRLVFTLRKLARANYEREMELVEALCDRTATGVDIGAKVGMYTYRIRAASADVIAFEPIPLFNNMLRAVFDGKRGRIEPYAVSRAAGKAVLRMPIDHAGTHLEFGRSTIDPDNALGNTAIKGIRELEVETRALDDYQLPSIGFIKIDVEGHELAVLDGARKTIAAHKPNLLVECNDDHQPDATKKLAEWLTAHGYRARFLDGTELRPIDAYDREEHWCRRGIENFICIHETRGDVVDRVRARAERIRS
jgi:FkbM family methyltransferase